VRKQLLGFAIALAILIIAVSAWVVWKSFTEQVDGEIPKTEVSETEGSEAIVATPENQDLKTMLETGKKFLEAGELEKAKSEFIIAAKLEPSAIGPLILLAEAQIHLKEFEKARENLKVAEKLDAINPDIFILRGVIHLREESWVEAEVEFGKAGANGKFWQGVMRAFFDKGEEAQKLLGEAADTRSAEILKAFTEYESFPDSPKTHLDTLLARSFVAIEEYELALAKLGPVLEDDADYRDAWLLTGYAQFARKNFEIAKQSWETAFALDSGKPETQYLLALVSFELKDFAEAEKFFLLARENRMEANDLEAKLAETYLRQGKYRAAADLLAEEIAKDRETSLENFVKPISLYLDKLKDGRNAWNLANLAKQRFPEEAFAHNLAGWVSLSNGYLPEARDQLEKSIELNPQLPWPYFNLGRYFEKTENPVSALAAYREAFALDSKSEVGVIAAQNYNRLLEKINPPGTPNPTENE
jgi:Tfp pilus assembly protein PilF